MSSLPKGRLTRQLTRLRDICSGPGAVKLPTSVVSIDLHFQTSNKNGHMGPRKFWRENLPQVQFHNPSVPISVTRYADEDGSPAILTIVFENGKEVKLDVKNKHSKDILQEFISRSGATRVPESEIPELPL